MMTTLTITLPHTPRCLSPNAKAPLTQRGAIVAGYKKTAAKSRARTMAGAVTLEALNGRRMQPTHYRVVWFTRGISRMRIIAWHVARRIWTGLAKPWALTTGRWIAPGLTACMTWPTPARWKSCLKGGTMKISLKRIVLLKQQEQELQDRLEQIREEIRFIESLNEEQLAFYEKRTLGRNIGARDNSEQASFRKYVKEELKKQGKNTVWLAGQIGKGIGTVKNWIYGDKNITEENIRKIETVLEKGCRQ